MNDIQIYKNDQFGEIRSVTIDREPWFVGKDVAAVLGYSNPRDALQKHVDNEDKATVAIRDASQSRNMTIINESGLYSLILSSKLPTAKAFKSWVTHDVLPAIRKTGKYETKPMTDYQQMMDETRRKNASIQTARLLMQLANQYDGTYRDVLNAHAAKELTGDFLLPLPQLEEKTYSAGEIGEMLGISANKVGIIANRNGLKTKEYGKWFHDKSRYSSKEVQSFRYFERVIPVLQRLLAADPPQ